MASLTVGGFPFRCVKDTWKRDPVELQGEAIRMENGALGSTQHGGKLVASGDVIFLSPEEADAALDAISAPNDPGVPVRVVATSDPSFVLRGQTVSVFATLGTIVARKHRVAGLLTTTWRGDLTLRQV